MEELEKSSEEEEKQFVKQIDSYLKQYGVSDSADPSLTERLGVLLELLEKIKNCPNKTKYRLYELKNLSMTPITMIQMPKLFSEREEFLEITGEIRDNIDKLYIKLDSAGHHDHVKKEEK